jgi:RluA family pseudouridine synthase
MNPNSTETTLRSKIPMNQAGASLLDYLSSRFRYQTRETRAELIALKKVTVNGQAAAPEQALRKGDEVAYSVVLKEPPVDRNIQILHQEETFLVTAKPGNLPSHADGNFIKNTFIHILSETLRNEGWKSEVKLVHRLDRETSGLMVVSKSKEAHAKLVRQFEEGTVTKEYLAVVKGEVERECFEISGAIGKDVKSQISIRRAVVPEGTPHSQPSLTLFERVQVLKGATLLKCVPKTGRTNQIRVHLDSTGHPVVGDKLYGKTDAEFLEFVRRAKAGEGFEGPEPYRHLLHAQKLGFSHPVTGAPLTFEAPLPEDMRDYIQKHASGGA